MRKIVAIGGGEIVCEEGKSETLRIEKEIIKLSGKRNPNLLFIPTASGDSASYCTNINNYFGYELGCNVSYLRLFFADDEYTAEEKIREADIVYVGGGNTFRMMKKWRSMGVDRMLLNAADEGTVMSGLSAGAICWFRYGASDSRKLKNPNADMIKVSGLGLVNATMCPHYSAEPHRKDYLETLMGKTAGIAIALDDCAAIEIIGDEYRIMTSNEKGNAYKVYWNKSEYHRMVIEEKKNFTPLGDLLSKTGDI